MGSSAGGKIASEPVRRRPEGGVRKGLKMAAVSIPRSLDTP